MSITPLLAEDIGKVVPLIIGLALLLICFGVFSVVCIPLNRGVGRGTWWGFAIGLFSALGGGFMFLACLTTVGGVPLFFTIAAAVPLAAGLWSLYLWGAGRENWPTLVLRVLLYGGIIIGCVWLFALYVRRY